MNKSELYSYIGRMRESLGLSGHQGAVSTIDIARRYLGALFLKFDDLAEPKVGGILFKGPRSLMVLNTLRTKEEQNFDCGHELIHFWLDPVNQYMCIDKAVAKRQPYPEWRANEGSAEFLIPHEQFIPEIAEYCEDYILYGSKAISETKKKMALKYNVTVPVITNRINSLTYEIDQYNQGVPLDKLEILSGHEQNVRGIKIQSYNDIERELQAKEEFSIAIGQPLCPACGQNIVAPYADVCDKCWPILQGSCK